MGIFQRGKFLFLGGLIVRPLAAVQENGQGSKRASWFFDRR